jgi:exodeoxyribonuclease-3
MKIVSWNVNGLRSVLKRNFSEWLESTDPDFLCLQEIKAEEHHLARGLFTPQTYDVFVNCASKKGYSGVAVYAKHKPERVKRILGLERFDAEGRMLQLEFTDFILICLYLPHGGRAKDNLQYKLDVYRRLLEYLDTIKDQNVVLAGDFNIAHQEIDLSRPKQNAKNIMFTAEERNQIDSLISLGFIDSFRLLHQEGQAYTWWPYMADARGRNIGWRIDYVFTSRTLSPRIDRAFISSEVTGSDHCPIGIEFRLHHSQ